MKKLGILTVFLIGCVGGEDRTYQTVFDVALAKGELGCEKMAQCGQITYGDMAECVDVIVSLNCDVLEESACDAEPAASDAQIGACLNALDAMSCSALETEDAPRICDGV